MTSPLSADARLRTENAELRTRLEEAEETLRAIRSGEVDSLVVETADGPQLFSLQAEERIIRQVRELDALYATVPTGLFQFDADLRFVRVNACMAAITGLPMEAHLGRTGSDVFCPEIARQLEPMLRRVLETGDPLVEAEVHGTTTVQAGERHWLVSCHPVRSPDGEDVGVHGVVVDITDRKGAEVELRESREFTRRVLDNLLAFVGVLTVDGTLIEANRAPLEGAGLSASEVLGKKFWDCHWWNHSPESQRRLRNACERAAAGEVVRCDAPVRMAGETIIWIDFQLAPLRDSDGRITHLIPSGMDITDRKRSEESLRQNAEVFVRLVDQAPTGMYVIDADFRMQQVNGLAAPVFANVDPLIGRDFTEVIEVLWGPVVGAEVVRIFRHTLDTGEHYVSPGFTEERQDIGGEEAYEWEVRRATLADGRYGVVCYFHDVTQRERADRAIRESKTRLRLATEATAVGIWERNVHSGALRWDAQMFRIYGIAPTADGYVEYSDWSGIVLPEDLPNITRYEQDAVKPSAHYRHEFRIRRRESNEIRDIEAVETVLNNGHGEAEWVLGTNLDITERKAAQESLRLKAEELARSARAKDDFLAALSHELRTPLTPVLMMATALGNDPALPLEVRKQLSMMRRNIELEARLIDDLLDLTRISKGKLVIDRQPTDIHQLLDHTAEIVLSDRLGKEVRIEFKNQAVRHHALADGTRLQQVFWNLIKNAVKFTPSGGEITVVTRNDDDGRIVVTVADTGLGISEEALPHIFRAFEQGDISGQHRYGGLGLGLAISQAIMEAHGGSILAESQGPDCGAVFTVILESVEATPALVPVRASPDSPSRALRLLIVEDHETTRNVLKHLLTNRGHQVTAAGTVQEALAYFAADHFDAVISDLGLPDGSGLDLMQQIHRIRPVPAIALSGYGMESDLQRTREAGFFAHLVKPVNLDQLRQLIDQIPPSQP